MDGLFDEVSEFCAGVVEGKSRQTYGILFFFLGFETLFISCDFIIVFTTSSDLIFQSVSFKILLRPL